MFVVEIKQNNPPFPRLSPPPNNKNVGTPVPGAAGCRQTRPAAAPPPAESFLGNPVRTRARWSF